MADDEVYCQLEGLVPREACGRSPDGRIIHVVDEGAGHTLRGLAATFRREPGDGGGWRLSHVRIHDDEWQSPDRGITFEERP